MKKNIAIFVGLVFLLIVYAILIPLEDGENDTFKSHTKSLNANEEDSDEYLTSFTNVGRLEIDSEIINVVEDRSTKCQYIYEAKVGQNFSLTPYYDEFGKVNGCKSQDMRSKGE